MQHRQTIQPLLPQLANLLCFSVLVSVPALAGPVALDTWGQFSTLSIGVDATGCSPADPGGSFCFPSSGTPTAFLDAGPWTFTAPAKGLFLTVTDVFASGDRYQIFDFGNLIGQTSLPNAGVDCGDDPVPCVSDPGMSSGRFLLAPGNHSITIQPLSDEIATGYLLVSNVPEPGAAATAGAGLGVIWLFFRLRRRHPVNVS